MKGPGLPFNGGPGPVILSETGICKFLGFLYRKEMQGSSDSNRAPSTYEEWLALNDEQQRAVHFDLWDTNARDGIGFAYVAAGRLALVCGRRVLRIEIGTYHGGEYLLHMFVSAEEFPDCPPMLQQQFEGFRVVWMPVPEFKPFDDSGATLEGCWISEDDRYEFEFSRDPSGLRVTGKVQGSSAEIQIYHSLLNEQFVLFVARDLTNGTEAQHSFRLIGPDLAEDNLTSAFNFRRKLKQAGAE